ncbi:hypothetical protein A3E66_04160 [Candidatus Daviesbacteria bacterium RIFCSPHIGHO2_12_FULL_37_16]|uniref:Membrane protein insertion efficiency factor YidD n=1 Tax=Candidatus Daviesbacteria bacterium RIFCSPHIGHO2_12_FULL_37_16 TaxID=1797778 RepID=A0A1F5K2C3_9BACT|nr:MAG: hypothetical protein A3C99_00305 [Candidatus Daviesbacteria bacterium RIFCSPHIGHO2_02_FULL_37_9]OGE34985.1 MAG: hypothetical protein A3E66_04160 [Candidatus Daviesbacteria bacterium RIFCSPHIGHO2_12_FULL_37_16]
MISIRLIEFYQKYLSFDRGILMFLAPGGACRYPVSCSEYTKRAIREFGVIRGSFLGIRRIISCR